MNSKNKIVQTGKKDRKKSIIKLAFFLIILASAILLIQATGVSRFLDKDNLQSWIESFGSLGPIVYISIYSVAPSLFLPGVPLTIAGGVAFGPLYGTIYTIIGATIGASVAFLVARYFARSQVEQLISGRLEELDKGVEKKGWVFVAITRLIPLFPFNLLNYAFGLTKIRFAHYAIASFIFMLPGTAAYVIFSSSFLDVLRGKLSFEFILGLILVITVSIVPVLYKKVKNNNHSQNI